MEADLRMEETIAVPDRDGPKETERQAVDRVWSYTYSYLLGAFLLIALI